MKSYTKYKSQIEGYRDVAETVKTVEKIAASGVHFLKQKVASLETYTVQTKRVLTHLSYFYENENHPLLDKQKIGNKALIILTGDKGLVGGLWHRNINIVLENIKKYQSFIVVGIKGKRYLEEEDIQAFKLFENSNNISEQEYIKEITEYVFSAFKDNLFSQVYILYPQFKSIANQTPKIVPFLPFNFNSDEITNSDDKIAKISKNGLPIFEPSKAELFDSLLKKYIGIFFQKIILETKLSELSARTVAMERASSKTKELIKKSRVEYIKEKRRKMTQGQLESFATHKTS